MLSSYLGAVASDEQVHGKEAEPDRDKHQQVHPLAAPVASVPSEERLLVLRRGRVLGACRAGDPPELRRLGAPPPHPGAVRLDVL
jgi:hypothetical protein